MIPDFETWHAIASTVAGGWSFVWQVVYFYVLQITFDWVLANGSTLFEDGSVATFEGGYCLEYLQWGCG